MGKLVDARECLSVVRSSFAEVGCGRTMTAIRESVDVQLSAVESECARLAVLIVGLEVLGEDLGVVESGLYAVLMDADQRGLSVVDGCVRPPLGSDPEYAVKRLAFTRLMRVVAGLRDVEAAAHAQFVEACKDAHVLPTEAVKAAEEWQKGVVAARSAGVSAAWATAELPGVGFVSPDSAARKAKLEAMILRGSRRKS
ncbi:hypothetical protein [Actinomyces culturomici]|uniref:hypothetical protein n=1 Tax=Actinomyces culturomici TaxID=1926276 RepID=UPI00135C02C1|nr:hypothetical protein [Actinomyces culturomici]